MKAIALLKEKRVLLNTHDRRLAVAELKIWRINKSKDYPAGIKYSLFLVCDGTVIVGFDNHKPKGPHMHFGDQELPYDFKDERELIEDFWEFARKAGFEI